MYYQCVKRFSCMISIKDSIFENNSADSNGGAIYMNYNGNGFFSFKLTVIFVIIACVPAIVSAYLFFIFDADFDEEDSDDERHEDQITFGMGYVAAIITLLVWLFYGTNILKSAV